MSTLVELPQTDTVQAQLQPSRPSSSCDKHPEEQFTGFCPSCLCERLTELEPKSTASSSSSFWKPPSITTSTAVAALKAIFKPSSSYSKPASSSLSFPELRRSKSFSASKNEGFPFVLEPQRKSCDVRVRSTLWSLFSQDDEKHMAVSFRRDASETVEADLPRVSCSSLPRISTSSLPPPVLEEEEDEEETPKSIPEFTILHQIGNSAIVDPVANALPASKSSNVGAIKEIAEEEDVDEDQIVIVPDEIVIDLPGVEDANVLKPVKAHMDLHESQVKKRDFKEIAGSFWSAASVFSKKLQKWRQKQKMKKQTREETLNKVKIGKLLEGRETGRNFNATQCEVTDYGFGRRSCDVDQRFSLDVGRMSFEDQPRFSLDEPRASWDGYVMAGRLSTSAFTKMPTMSEDCPVDVITNNINGIVNCHTSGNTTTRCDGHIPVEFDEVVPGGTAQTREYYLDTSSRRRRSIDRSNSIRKTAAAVVAEIDEIKNACNGKVNPPDLRDTFPTRDGCSLTLELGCGEDGRYGGNGTRPNMLWRWGRRWSIWGFKQRRNANKDAEDDRFNRRNSLMQRSLSESWHDSNNVRFNPNVGRSVSWRSSCARKSNAGERNRSARYSPTSIDNGMLRLYLTPVRGGRRVAWGKEKQSEGHSIANSVLRLY